MRRVITLLILILSTSCGSYTLVKYSDQLYKPITREKLYMPRAGGNGLRAEFQWQRNYNRWYNYYFLDLNSFYYNPYFANYWWWGNQWRFNSFTYTQPIYSPRPLPRPRPRTVPQRQPRQRNRVYSPIRRGSTQQVTPRSNPNLRTNVQPRRQSTPNVRSGRTNSRRFNQNN